MNNCVKDVVNDGLIFHIDISDTESYDLNTEFTVNSLKKWSDSNLHIDELDFGYTAYDFGRVSHPTDGILETYQNPTLFRIYKNTSTGLSNVGLNISAVNDPDVGEYFELNGGYLHAPYKMQGTDFAFLPSRYKYGFTFETMVKVNSNSKGIILFLGARSEDKYTNPYYGECYGYKVDTIDNTIDDSEIDGVVTSHENHLISLDVAEKLNNFAMFSNMRTVEKKLNNGIEDIKSNAFSIGLTDDKKIEVMYVDGDAKVKSFISKYRVDEGWHMITLTFKPDYINDACECCERRTGLLSVFVDGLQYISISDFEEFYTHDFSNTSYEEVLGVPHNIVWGNGSYGLKNAWRFDHIDNILYRDGNVNDINSMFSLEYYSHNILKPCPIDVVDTNNDVNLTMSTEVTEEVDCDGNAIEKNYMNIEFGANPSKQTFVRIHDSVELMNRREYVAECKLFLPSNIFSSTNGNRIKIAVEDPTNSTIILEDSLYYDSTVNNYIAEFSYENSLYAESINEWITIDSETSNDSENVEAWMDTNSTITTVNDIGKWITIRTKFRIKNAKPLTDITVGILVESVEPVKPNTKIAIDYFTLSGCMDIIEYPESDFFGTNFDNSFIGGIQKLRIYEKPLSVKEVKNNVEFEASNKGYGITVAKGGRLIYG